MKCYKGPRWEEFVQEFPNFSVGEYLTHWESKLFIEGFIWNGVKNVDEYFVNNCLKLYYKGIPLTQEFKSQILEKLNLKRIDIEDCM